MQMIDVLSRLAALDSENSNVVNPMSTAKKPVAEDVVQLPELQDMSTLRALSGLKPVNECGPMGLMGGTGNTPASFSINASAATGDEVAGMLTQIMNLAGVVKGTPDAQPHHDADILTGEPPVDMHSDKDIMRSTMDKLNMPGDDDGQPEDEGTMMLTGPVAGGMEDEGEMGGGGGPVADMADEVRDMADELAGTDKEELGLESYDNTPNNPNDIPAFDSNKMAYNPNATKAGDRMDGNMPKGNATFEDQLYAEYKKFVSEAAEKTMSRAAKGYEKYGKEGMKALAKAGKEGKDLDKVRDKYNKYDESTGDYSAKKAAAGKDIGKPGKNFSKIAAKSGGGAKGERIAGAVLKKLRAKG